MMICRKLTWDSPRTVSAIALGALIHDIGMTTLPEEIKNIRMEQMSEDQLKIYQTHPTEGMKKAMSFEALPSSVLQIILQHHECNHKGFPNGISSVKIYPLAKVVCLADRFTNFLIDNKLSAAQGLKTFVSNKVEMTLHDQEMIKAMIKSFIKEEAKEQA
jgi:HD-GYP domain-containing protein (c-di-GMP phosphodiesterase class II)